MKGLQLSRQYYEAYGQKMLHEQFPMLENRAAVGLVGQGSECLGFDDEISKDHDYGPSFCIWLTDEDYTLFGEELTEAYDRLPKVFQGLQRIETEQGKGRVGVLRTSDFYIGQIGRAEAPADDWEWMWIPENRLCTATNGNVFVDPLGEFTRIRQDLLQFYPEDVRKKKIAARAVTMAQSGQYNYPRLMKRNETVAASMALAEFTRHTISMVHLLHKKYTPFYKWMHRSLMTFPMGQEIGIRLTKLVNAEYEHKLNTIEEICSIIIAECRRQQLSDSQDTYLEAHAYEVMSRITNPKLQSLHVMEG